MRNHRLLTLALCLLLLCSLLAGCSPAPEPGTHTSAQPKDQSAPAGETGKAGDQSAAAGEAAADAPAAAPEPTPGEIRLSAGSFPSDLEELTAVVTPEDLPLMAGFSALKLADFRGSRCQQELAAWALEHPEVSVCCEIRLSDGTEVSADTRELDLTGRAAGEDLLALVLLPELRSVELGSCDNAADSDMDWEALAKAEAACPDAEFRYAFRLFGKSFDLQSTEMDLNHITMDDEGALVKKVAPCLPGLTLLDMDFCAVSDEAMAEIRDSLPDTEVIWRIWFGTGYTARTNAIKILASNPGKGGELTPENTRSLKYCTKVVYLDLGHNDQLTDISFVSCMPDLEVLILALGGVSDLRPLADCPKLEYLEIQTSPVSDLRPLAGLKNLRHLNVGHCFALSDITPLYGLTELERLWLGAYDPVSRDQIEEMQRRAPDCEIDYTAIDPTAGRWRYIGTDAQGHGVLHPRYILLHEQFGYGSAPYCYNYIENDPLYRPHN